MKIKEAENNSHIIHQIAHNSEKRVMLFNQLEINKKGFILLRMSSKIQKELLHSLTNDELLQMLEYLDPDETTDIIQNLEIRRGELILKKLQHTLKEKVEYLLKFNPKTAAGLMSLDFVEVQKGINFGKLGDIIRIHEKRTGKVPTILVIDNGELDGEIKAHFLAITNKTEIINKHIKKIPSIHYNASKDEIINIFKTHPHDKIVVLDDDLHILGIIYSDDILRLIESNTAQHLSDFAGIDVEEDVLDSALMKVKYRYKWLILNLFTVFLAAGIISLFEKTISSLTLLAIYMPIIAGMGGNAGTQTLAIAVRGIALKELSWKNGKGVILKEMIAGSINGLINGILVAIIAYLWHKTPMLGLILFISMIISLVIAVFFGAIIPLIMKSLGKDPATSATIFITTATDVFGFLTFLGLATLFL